MKSIITLSAITMLAAFGLAGCNQNTPDSSTATPGTNSSMNPDGGMGGVTTNLPATNSLPDMSTNVPASTNK